MHWPVLSFKFVEIPDKVNGEGLPSLIVFKLLLLLLILILLLVLVIDLCVWCALVAVIVVIVLAVVRTKLCSENRYNGETSVIVINLLVYYSTVYYIFDTFYFNYLYK